MKKILILLILILIIGCSKESKEVIQIGNLKLSSVFENNQEIPAKYTCQGDDINPPLTIDGIPETTKTLVLIMDDPDAPAGTWDHWLVWNIAPTAEIKENSVPGIQGRNSWGRNDYGGPCPPSVTHRYVFKLYALDIELDLPEGADKKELEAAISGHVLAQTQLIGLYAKK
jgi:Raf kinase inhibitor-like YbhB/YbcL family protein